METYSSIQDVKYDLKARKPLDNNRAVKVFSRKERHKTPINPKLSNIMRKAYTKYNAVQRQKAGEEKELRKKFDVETPKAITAKKLKEKTSALAEKETEQHQEVLAEAYNLKRLCEVVVLSYEDIIHDDAVSSSCKDTSKRRTGSSQTFVPLKKRKMSGSSSISNHFNS